MTSFRDQLTHLKTYDEKATEVAFLLGGIGTGNVSVGSRGQLRDWEIFNHPGKNTKFPYTFFAMHVKADGKSQTRVLEAPIQPPYANSHGFDSSDVCGFPRMRKSVFRAEYPLVAVDLIDESLPVCVTMEAYTPFIPLNVDDSSIPGAIIRYRVRNTGKARTFVSIAASLANMTTFESFGQFNYPKFAGATKNTLVEKDGLAGVLMESVDMPKNHPMNASLAISTTNPKYTAKPNWYEGGWFDRAHDFWDDFSEDGKLELVSQEGGEGNKLMDVTLRIGSIAPNDEIEPGEEKVFEFLLAWNFKNRVLGWNQAYDPNEAQDCQCSCCNCGTATFVGNYYALKYENALSVAEYMKAEMVRLEADTLAFHNALFTSTLPQVALDAVAANITVLRSTTCFRIEDGTFFGWEGCFDNDGCCDGNCTHVWNYAQTLAYLFPTLEQSMRENEFLREVEADGKMNFRARKRLQDAEFNMHPAADGQMGSIVRFYREWMLSGDDRLVEKMGKSVLHTLDFSIMYWDSDRDNVLDSQQHNTYDIEFYGPNSLVNSIFFAALKAGVEIAKKLGQTARAEDYQRRFEAGSKRMDEMLWGGEYYIQLIDDINQYKYQYGKGCLSDQMIGQFMAHTAGLGYVLPEEHVKQAICSIYKYNMLKDFTLHENAQRTYALEGEQGLLLCSWPQGGRPRFPFVYSDEVWTGIEYQVAANLIYEGFVEEGLDIVRAVRERHDGIRRNPFNEVECGHHYARAMASWGVLTALSGFSRDRETGKLSFAPRINADNFSCFYSDATQWGIYRRVKGENGEIREEIQKLYEAK